MILLKLWHWGDTDSIISIIEKGFNFLAKGLLNYRRQGALYEEWN